MTDRPASNTAVGVAMLRAAHQLLDGLPRVLDDTVALRMFGRGGEEYVREHADRLLSPRATALRAHVLLRSRYAEERLHGAVLRGVTQLLVLGAGLDTFAYRQPEWAHALRIYEVDHPESQRAKQARLATAGIEIAANLTFVSVDFEHETLRERLEACGFDFGAPVFVSCLGVLVHLTMDAVTDLFRFFASLAPGSECVLTFGGTARPSDPGTPTLGDLAAAAGEPFRSPLEVGALNDLCASVGLPAPVFPTPDEIGSYLGARTDGIVTPARTSIASIMVAPRS